jgi:hypothetical protein
MWSYLRVRVHQTSSVHFPPEGLKDKGIYFPGMDTWELYVGEMSYAASRKVKKRSCLGVDTSRRGEDIRKG